MNGFTKRIIACTALVLVAGALAAPVPAFAQIVESDLRRMSVEQLRDQLQQFRSGEHELSTQDARREMRKLQRELQRRSANREQIQQQQPPQVQQPQPQQPQQPRLDRHLRRSPALRRLSRHPDAAHAEPGRKLRTQYAVSRP